MEYSAVIKIIPAILSTIKAIIDIYNSNPKNIKGKMKGHGFNKNMLKLEELLTNLHHYREVLLFYSRFLPESAAIYALSDKLAEMVQSSLSNLSNNTSIKYDAEWGSITMMFNTAKLHKNNNIISRRDACPYSTNSEEIKEINRLIRELEAEFDKADAFIISREAKLLLSHTSNIARLSSDLRTTIMNHTEKLINSISTEINVSQ